MQPLFQVGVGKLVGRKLCKNMHKEIKLEVDGKVIDLPCLEGIIILNIMRFVKFAPLIKVLEGLSIEGNLTQLGIFGGLGVT